MKPLRDYFSEGICKMLKHHFNIMYVEQAQQLTDNELMSIRRIGKKFCYNLRNIEPDDKPNPVTKLPIALHSVVLMYALHQLPNPRDVQNNFFKIGVVQDQPIVLIFEKSGLGWLLTGVEK